MSIRWELYNLGFSSDNEKYTFENFWNEIWI